MDANDLRDGFSTRCNQESFRFLQTKKNGLSITIECLEVYPAFLKGFIRAHSRKFAAKLLLLRPNEKAGPQTRFFSLYL
jgi:hypothetical protein